MTINFPVLKRQKFQIGDVVHYKSKEHFGDDEFVGIITGSYAQKCTSIYTRKNGGHNEYELYIPKWLNPKIKKTAPYFTVPNTFAWATNRELKLIKKLTEEEKVKFLAEFYKIYITLS